MAGMGSWFRSISSLTNSMSRFTKIAVDGQLNSTRSKFAFVNSGLALTGSIMRLGTKVVDYAGSKITGKPRKNRSKAPTKASKAKQNKSNNNKSNKDKGYSDLDSGKGKKSKYAQQNDFRKEDHEAKKRLKKQGIDDFNPMSFVDDNANEVVKMPQFKITDKEREAMEQLANFNASNRGYDSDGVATGNAYKKDDKMQKLYDYLETTEYFREGIEYTEDKTAIVVKLKPLDIQTSDEFFVNFQELILSPTAIMNPFYENYLQMANINPSKLMTNLLQDYHVERAPMLYFVINYYIKSNTK